MIIMTVSGKSDKTGRYVFFRPAFYVTAGFNVRADAV